MSVEFTVGGRDYLPFLSIESVNWDDAIAEDGDAFECLLVDTTGTMQVPKTGEEVVLIVNGVKEFAGVVLMAQFEHISHNKIEILLRCRGYVYWLNRKLVAIDTQNWLDANGLHLAGDVVRNIINQFVNPGLEPSKQFSVDGVRDGYAIPRQQFDYMRVGQVLDAIAQEIEYSWWVDFDRNIHFVSLEEVPGPDDDIDYDQNHDYFSLSLTEDCSQVVNRVYVKNVKGKADGKVNHKFTSDGTTSFFPLQFEPSEVSDAEVTINGVTQTVLEDPNVPNPPPGCYLCVHNWGLRIVPPPAPPPGGGTGNVSINYGYLFPKVIVVEDSASIAEMQARGLGTDGVFEHSISMDLNNRILVEDVAVARAKLILLKYAWPMVRGTLSTYRQGWKAGQYFRLTTDKFKVANQSLDKRMYVISTNKTLIKNDDGGVVVLTRLTISDNYWSIK